MPALSAVRTGAHQPQPCLEGKRLHAVDVVVLFRLICRCSRRGKYSVYTVILRLDSISPVARSRRKSDGGVYIGGPQTKVRRALDHSHATSRMTASSHILVSESES